MNNPVMKNNTDSPNQPTIDLASDHEADQRHAEKLLKIINKRSFCTLASTSEANRSHSAGVVYQAVDGDLWVHTTGSSRKARNVGTTGHVGVGLAFRRLPVGPPYTIHFQSTARLVPMDDPEVTALIETGRLGRISGHGALTMKDGCFIKIDRPRSLHSYGPGANVIALIRDPLNNGARSVRLDRSHRISVPNRNSAAKADVLATEAVTA